MNIDRISNQYQDIKNYLDFNAINLYKTKQFN